MQTDRQTDDDKTTKQLYNCVERIHTIPSSVRENKRGQITIATVILPTYRGNSSSSNPSIFGSILNTVDTLS